MPCWTVNTISVDLKAADWELLKKAVASLGYVNVFVDEVSRRMTFIYGGRTVTVERDKIIHAIGAESVVTEIKRGYAQTVVKAAAERFRWGVKEAGENKLQISRRF